MIKKCKKCGLEYNGSSHSWYCPKCKSEILFGQRQKDLERIKNNKIEGICVICGKKFVAYHKKETCGPECDKKLKSIRQTGHEVNNITKRKIAEKNCIEWHLISPEGKHYYFRSLNHWLRENGKELFGCDPDSREFTNVRTGISGAKRAMLGGKYGCCTYKGWKVIPAIETEKNHH